MSLHYLVKPKKNTKSHHFTQMLYPAAQDFNQSMLDVFSLLDSQLHVNV